MLFVIVAAFLLCSMPRFTLNIVEFVSVLPWYYSKYFGPESAAGSSSCLRMPAWTHVLTSVSSFLMTLNASLGFLIYCVACKAFKDELRKIFRRIRFSNRGQAEE